jgi:hypothetical protein
MVASRLRGSVLGLVTAAALFSGRPAIAQNFDANIVSRVDNFIPPPKSTVLPTKTKQVEVTQTEHYTETIEETHTLTSEERDALARDLGVVVPLGLRSTTARRAYLNLRNVPTKVTKTVRKEKTRKVTKIVEKKEPRKTTASISPNLNFTYSSNANLTNIDVLADSIEGQSANLLILVPAGGDEDTVAFTLGPTAVRYVDIGANSFDAVNANITYTHLIGRRQTAPGFTTGGTATTDLFSAGIDGTSVYEPGFGASEIAVATPSITWSRGNIGLGNSLCGPKGSEAYCYYANVSVKLAEYLADISTQTKSAATFGTTLGWRPPINGLSVTASGSVKAVYFSDYPGGRQDLLFDGTANFFWSPNANLTVGAGVEFTQQISSHSDLDWNGFNLLPQVLLNWQFH